LAALRAGTSVASATTTAYGLSAAASGESGPGRVAAGIGGVARAGVGAAASAVRGVGARIADAFEEPVSTGRSAAWRATGGSTIGGGPNSEGSRTAESSHDSAPSWARRLRNEQLRRAQFHAAVDAVKEGDRAGGEANPNLDPP